MIKKVYITDNEEDIIYEARIVFPGIKSINCENVQEHDFTRLHSPSLFCKDLILFYNVHNLPDAFLLDVISGLKIDVVWGFKSLPKNRKLYKKLCQISNVTELQGIKNNKDKKSFISSLLKSYNIPSKYMEKLMLESSDSKQIIFSEVQKLNYAINVLKDKEVAENCLCNYNSSSDVFEFINNLFEYNLEGSYIYAKKICESNHQLTLGALLNKKIKSMLFLSIGSITEANRFWRYGNYYITKAINQSKSIGFNKLASLLDFIDNKFNNVLDQKDLFLKLNELIYIVNATSRLE